MNCEGISTILDERREQRLSAAERCAVDEHLASCSDCGAAWHAQSMLHSLVIPATPANVLRRALELRAAPARRRVPQAALGAPVPPVARAPGGARWPAWPESRGCACLLYTSDAADEL